MKVQLSFPILSGLDSVVYSKMDSMPFITETMKKSLPKEIKFQLIKERDPNIKYISYSDN